MVGELRRKNRFRERKGGLGRSHSVLQGLFLLLTSALWLYANIHELQRVFSTWRLQRSSQGSVAHLVLENIHNPFKGLFLRVKDALHWEGDKTKFHLENIHNPFKGLFLRVKMYHTGNGVKPNSIRNVCNVTFVPIISSINSLSLPTQ